MNRSRNNRPPTFSRLGTVMMNELKIIFKRLAFLISLKILPILKAQMIVACGPTLKPVVNETTIDMSVPTTIVKSNTFQPSLK